MDTAYKTCFERLDSITPCCTQPISLNELNYDWPAGFAKFVIEIQEPNIKGFEADQVQHLKKIIGIELRQIWAYY